MCKSKMKRVQIKNKKVQMNNLKRFISKMKKGALEKLKTGSIEN